MALAILQVIRIFDEFIRPPKPKMIVCVEPNAGYFFRINSENKWPVPVFIGRADHPFLDHDSYVECGAPLEFSDYIIEQSMLRFGLLGSLHSKHAKDIGDAVAKSYKINDADRQLITSALGRA